MIGLFSCGRQGQMSQDLDRAGG